MNLDITGLKPLDVGGLTPVAPDGLPIDVSGLKPLDASGLTAVSAAPAQTPSPDTSLSDYPVEFGKGVLEGAKNLPASAMKGMGAAATGFTRDQRAIFDRIDRGERVPETDDPVGYQHMTPEQRIAARADIDRAAAVPLTQGPLYRAGQAVENFGKETLAPAPGFEKSWTRDIGSGVGSIAAGIGMSMVPVVGPYAAQATFLGAGQGEAVEGAIHKGATEQQAIQAARLGTIPGATDALDMLLPQLGSIGRALGFIRRVGVRAIEGALLEGGQEGVQQLMQNAIAIGIYDPNRDIMDDVPRSAAIGAIVGGATSGGFAAAQRQEAPARSSPGEITDFIQAAQATSPVAAARAAQSGAAFDVASGGRYDPTIPRLAGPAGATVAPAAQQTAPSAQQTPPGVPAGAIPAETILPADPVNQPFSTTVESPAGPIGAPLSGGAVLADASAEVQPPAQQPPAALGLSGNPVELDAGDLAPLPAPSTRPLLESILNDPRPAEEIRAEMDAAKAWAPTAEWQPVPPGVVLPPGLQLEEDDSGTGQLARLMPAPGTRQAPVQLETSPDPNAGAEQTVQPKSMAQAEAGNYRKRHVKWFGLNGAIETEAGQERTGIGGDGVPWSVTLEHPYGEFKRTEGKDGDPVDFYVGPHPESDRAVIVDQVDPDTRRFDEHKVIIGVRSGDEALAVYNSGFSDGSAPHRFGAAVEMSAAELKTWLEQGDTKKPIAYTNPPVDRSPKGPLSLTQFLAKNGGIRDHGGELRHLGLDRMFVPGFGRLVRSSGVPLDRAREAAVEAGYLHDAGAISGGVSESFIDDLLEALDSDARGDRVYSAHDVEAAQARESQRQEKANAEELKRAIDDVRELAKSEGINATAQEIEDAAKFALVNGTDLIDGLIEIIERSAYAVHDEVVALEPQEQGDEQPAADDTGRSDQGGAGSAPSGDRAARPEAAAAAEPAPRGEQPGQAQQPRGEARVEPPAPVTRDTPPPSKPVEKIDIAPKAPETGPSDSVSTTTHQTVVNNDPTIALARALLERLKSGQPITAKILQDEATKAHGGSLAEGKFDRKDAHDALELAVNMHIAADPGLRAIDGKWQAPFKRLGELLARLPTQRVRSDEMVAFDQFSTPPNYALATIYAANLRDGDLMAEPSAGTGSLVAAATRPGVTIVANELSDRRGALLRELVGKDGRVFKENAEQLDNVLPDNIKPSVVVMNPPFSQTAGRMGDKKVPMTPAVHIEAALKRLEPGGRLVAIVGRGMTMGSPTFRAWWRKIGEKYTVVANIGVAGGAFEKYGTTFGTRLVVIDKVQASADHKPVLVEAQTVEDLMRALEPIRDARPQTSSTSVEQHQRLEPGSATRPDGSEGGSAGAPSASAEPRSLGTGEQSDRGVAGSGSDGTARAGQSSVRMEAPGRNELAAVKPERPGQGRADGQPAQRNESGVNTEGSGSGGAQRNLQPPAKSEPSAAAVGERVGLEQVAPGKQGASEISESLYQPYEPARVRVKGAKPHPGPLVESASMASVSPPPATYAPHLPKNVIEKGLLSLAQLETTVYAGQAHSKMLPAGDGEKPMRRGFFIGDGTGVGKGREIAGIILDNFQQGRKKAVWVSEKQTLLTDAKRDWGGLGQNPNLVFNAGKVKTGEPISANTGIGFITYDTLKGGMSDQEAIARGGFVRKQKVSVNGQSGTVAKIEAGNSKRPAQITVDLDNKTRVTVPANEVTATETTTVKSRVDQLVDWVGEDFDGVIAFDEAHNMGNAATTKGDRGFKDAAQKALAGIALQDRLPNARVVYVSATGATEVSNLAFANRLGLWGRGTPFASREKFMADIEEGGIAAMELIARDMKQLGLYTARNLSFDGVEYSRVEHKLDANQREIYDTLAEAWQSVLRNIDAALEETGGDKDARAKSAAKSAFWGAHQRFFNQVISSMQMPSVIEAVEKDLAAGRQAVLQLTNTNEASQERAAAKATTAEQIEDLDITPRDQIIQLVERSFPTQEYEQYSEMVDGKAKTRSRPVVDSAGEPVQNKQALRMKEELIDKLASVRVPQGPLDMVLDHFGIDVVAEVTGRGRRFVLKPDEKTGERKRTEESRPGSSNLAETDAFQAGKKKILVFSEAGGTGRSYHADNTSASKGARRAHYLVQGGWRADKAVQGFGRTHRTNQASAPIVKLVTTDLQGQKRFISSIARRLSQLGALTKGQRQAGDQGIFSARDNLESTEATSALRQFYTDLLHDNIKGVSINEFEEQTGLQLRIKDDDGRVSGTKEDLPPITQFLNRLLSLKIDMQNRVFDAFSERLDRVIEARQAAGLLDVGLETVKADKIVKDSEKVVHTIEDTSAETKHVKFTLSNKFVALNFDKVANSKDRPIKFFVRSPKGKVYAVAEASSLTDEKGKIVDYYRLINGVSGSHVVERTNVDTGKGWDRIDRGQAETLWKAEIDKAPEFISYPMHLITGAILPIWDRLKGSARVVRLQSDNGEQFIGRVIPNSRIADTLKALGAEADAPKVTPESLHAALSAGGRATLANGWVLKRVRVANEQRIELTGPSSFSEGTQVKKDGAFTERINFTVRYFVPTSLPDGPETLQRLTRYRPVVELTEANARPTSAAAGDEGMFSAAPDGWGVVDAGPAQRMSQADQAKVKKIVSRVAGIDPKLAESITIPANSPGAAAWGKTEEGKAQGVYHPAADAITIALDTGGPRPAYHEAFHRLQRRFLNQRELAVLESETGKLRDMLRDDVAQRDVDKMSPVEVQAEAFAAYAVNQDAGKRLNNILKRAWNRLRLIFSRLRNVLNGMGYQTSEDIFEQAKKGEIVNRGANPIAADGKPLFSAKAETVQTADGPRVQLVIPGAEKISDKELAERRAAEPKRATKVQKSVDGLPLFAGEPNPQSELFSLAEEPGTAVERHKVMQGFLARGQFIDRALRMPFDVLGGTTKDGIWKPGAAMFDKAASVITRAEFSAEGRFAFLNPIMETARAGLVDRYALRDMPDYVDRERKRALDERAVMLQGVEALKSLKDHGVGREEAKVLQAILTGEQVAAGDMEKLSEPIRAAIDQLGQEAVALGMVSPESYERNRGTYLHRVYQKYEAEQSGLARMVNRIMGSKRKKIIGDQFKGRGLFQEVDVARLMKDVPGWNEAARGKPQKGEAFILLDEMPSQGSLALNDDTSKVKPLRRIYWPAETAIPDRYDGFRNQGMWEVRAVDGGKITLWRDFTKEERTKMGEILDARYTIGKTFMLMAHDLANGRFYKDIAENEGWARSTPPNAKWLDASEWSAQRQRAFKHGDVAWVKVPDAEIPNSGGKKRWGALAGKWVREEIWRDLNELQIMQTPGLWRALLTQWKLNKTARSPVVHMNNVMSNFVLMDMIDVRFQDFAAGIRSYLKGDDAYKEAFANGAFGGDMMSQEVRDQVLKPILEELERGNTYQQGGHLGALGQVSKFTESLWSKLKAVDAKMIDAYRVEDEIFRMATYMRRRQLGDDPKQAAEVAREQFIDYDVRAPWINAARNTVLPFITYTYRAAPMVARAIATRPWKLGKYFLLTYMLNALAYALTGDDDEDADARAKREDRERRSLRENEQGRAWLGTPRMLRLPINDRYNNPLFLDIRRWVPASDIFDTQGNDMPAWLNLGGPLMIGAELFLNRNAFTGEPIVNTKTDDIWDRMEKRGDHVYKSYMPSAAWVPNSWYWDKIGNAVNGATDAQGRPYSVTGAIGNSVGIKVKPQDVEDGLRWKAYEFSKVEQELSAEARRLARRRDRKIISESEFDRAMADIGNKRRRLNEKREKTLD